VTARVTVDYNAEFTVKENLGELAVRSPIELVFLSWLYN
jgi:hypothetical protein